MIFEPGRLCVKLAGRDAGRKCVVVEVTDATYVVVDGLTRRKKVNIKHLEPLPETIDIKSAASHEDVVAAFSKLGVEIPEKKSRSPTERPKKQKKNKAKEVKEKKVKPKSKKEEKKPLEETLEKVEEKPKEKSEK